MLDDKMEERTQNGNPDTKGCSSHASFTLRGIALSFISGLTVTGSFAIVKYLNNIYPGEIAVYRFWCISSLTLPQIIWKKEEILGPPSHRVSLLVMAFANASAVFLIYFATRYLPLGEAAVVYGSHPVFVTIAGKIFLKETFGILHLTTVFTTVAGLVLTTDFHQSIVGHSFTRENIYGIAAALGALASLTALFTLWRKMKAVHYSVLLFSTGTLGIIESAILTASLGNFTLCHSDLELGFIILVGFLSYVSLLFTVVSSRYLEAGPMAMVKSSSDVFFAFLFQSVIFHDTPKPSAIFGAALVCISITLLGLGQKYKTLVPNRCFNLF